MPRRDVKRIREAARQFSATRWVRLITEKRCVCGESVSEGHTYCEECLAVKRFKGKTSC